MEKINPVFDTEAGGSFSYPVTIPVEENQHLLQTVTNHHGAQVYELIYHKPFRLYVGGLPLLSGIIDIDDEVDVDEKDNGTHEIEFALIADKQEFSSLIEGVNAQDIPVKDKIPVGSEVHSLNGIVEADYVKAGKTETYTNKISIDIPSNVFSLNKYKENFDGSGEWVNATNVSEPYPAKPYCNVDVCIQKREKQSDGSYKTLREYEVFDADRPNSGICFYVQYFLDCLFYHLNILYNNLVLTEFEDFNRLAFFTAKCECDTQQTPFQLKEEFELNGGSPHVRLNEFSSLFQKTSVGTNFTGGPTTMIHYRYRTKLRANLWIKYANSKNFPDVDVKEIIDNLQDAFGIRFIFDSEKRFCKAIFVKDIFQDSSSVKHGAIVHDVHHIDNNLAGVKLSYGGEGTEYNYNPNDDNSRVVIRSGYSSIRGENGIYDKRTFYDQNTGNFYRIKVDEDAKNVEELYPSLFEVGQFQDALVGNTIEEDKVKTISISFLPVISNIIEYIEAKEDVVTTNSSSSRGRGENLGTTPSKSEDCHYATFLPIEMDSEKEQKVAASIYSRYSGRDQNTELFVFRYYELFVKYATRYGYTDSYIKENQKYSASQRDVYAHARERTNAIVGKTTNLRPIASYEESPMSTYDAGFTLGVMRGPGNDAGVDVVENNYDNNGNAKWSYVSTAPAFTADSINHYGKPFDYNGMADGGVDTEGQFSLKLQPEKRIRIQNAETTDGMVVVNKKMDAAYWISYLFQDADEHNFFQLAPRKLSDIHAAGWDVTGRDNEYTVFFPVVRTFSLNDVSHTVLLNAITSDGTILTNADIQDYIDRQGLSRGQTRIYDDIGILMKDGATQKDADDLYGLLQIYYFPETAQPYVLTDMPEIATTDFYPIDASAAHRGLLHKFNYEYFYFLLHSRIIVLEVTLTIQELNEIDLLRWHTFGQYTGLIEKMSYDIDEEGLSDVTIHLRYL